MKNLRAIHILGILLMFSMVIGIMSCGEDEENIAQKPNSNSGLITPTTQVSAEHGEPHHIAWVRVDPLNPSQKVYTEEHIYTYDLLEQQNVLAVIVLDENNRPVPGARVEWTLLDSPNMVGDIIETDDPGFQQAGPQLKVDNKFAFTFTNQDGDRTRTAEFRCPTEVLEDGNEEITVKNVGEAGETWVVITAARKGLTDIAAYCPDIPDESRHKIFATKVWDCYDWEFPDHEVNNCEDDIHTFTTRIFNYPANAPCPAGDRCQDMMGVRYTILNPQRDSIFTDNNDIRFLAPILSGEASATLQASLNPPPSEPIEVRVEVLLRDNMDICDGREVVIGCTTVTKRWEVETLTVTTPNELISCSDAGNITGTFCVTNNGPPSTEDLTLIVDYPQGITVVDTAGGTDNGNRITWNIGILAAGNDACRSPIFAASSGGVYAFDATTQSRCSSAAASWTVRIIEVTATCLITPTIIDLDGGEVFPSIPTSSEPRYIATYTVTVNNIGGEAVTATIRIDNLPDGLRFEPLESGEPKIIEQLNPGGTVRRTFQLKGTAEGLYTVEAIVDISSATDESIICNPLSTQCDIEVVATPALQVEKIDTADSINVGHLTRYRIIIWNEGTADAHNLTIRDTLPAKMDLVTDENFLRNNPDLDPRDLYLMPGNPDLGLNLENVVVCQVELVAVDYATGNVAEQGNPIKIWNGPFNRSETINVPEGIAPGTDLLSGNTTLRIDAVGRDITFTFDRVMPTWAFRLSFYAQANEAGSITNRAQLTYEYPEGTVLPEDGPVNFDEPTTIR